MYTLTIRDNNGTREFCATKYEDIWFVFYCIKLENKEKSSNRIFLNDPLYVTLTDGLGFKYDPRKGVVPHYLETKEDIKIY